MKASITVVMPVRDCAATVATAIRSIIHQTADDWSLLILDDGSRDDTVSIACDFEDERVTVVVDGRHEGLATRLNQGIGMATTRFVARMDGDDVSYPERLACQKS